MQRNGRMSIGAGIDDDAGSSLAGFVDPVHQITLVAGLTEIHLQAVFGGSRATGIAGLVQRLAPVDTGFALAERVQIGPVKYINGFRHQISLNSAAVPAAERPLQSA